jgi:hypothetical protein
MDQWSRTPLINLLLNAGGCYARKITAINQLKDFNAWKDGVGYGSRWSVESVFSCMARMFGEYVRARKYSNMVREMVITTNLYNRLVSM